MLLICPVLMSVGSLPQWAGITCRLEVRGESSLAPHYDDHGQEVEVENEADLQTHLIIPPVTLNQLTSSARDKKSIRGKERRSCV